MKWQRKPSCAGYSLTEMMVVVSVIGTLSLAGALNMRSSGQNQQMELAVRHVLGQLQEARQQALSQSADVHIRYNTTRREIELMSDGNGDGVISTSEVRRHAVAGIGKVRLSWPTVSGVFTSAGKFATSATFWEVMITDVSGASRFIQVFPSGSVRQSARSLVQAGT